MGKLLSVFADRCEVYPDRAVLSGEKTAATKTIRVLPEEVRLIQ
jgi:hypothetical protein